ncbi:MAG: right-handed parallel beta-helix repeat-containing protein, partial [Candidatus Marinimicrobia bacterium]|nr:right-handed parallel beta-helix repeat-containing protein [Candidatus Neomarinimicrobiota bacterium]
AFGKGNVYVHAKDGAYLENVMLKDGVTLWGAGSVISGFGGKTYGGTYPTVDGGGNGPTITMANNTTVKGLRIINTGPSTLAPTVALGGSSMPQRIGIYAEGVTNLRIENNIVEHTDIGALILPAGGMAVGADGIAPMAPAFLGGDLRVAIDDTLFRNNAAAGAVIQGWGASGTFDVWISNSSFLRNGMGLEVRGENYDDATLQIRDTLFAFNQGNGFTAVLEADRVNVKLNRVAVRDSGAVGGLVQVQGNETADVRFKRFTTTGNAGPGLLAIVQGGESALLDMQRVNASGNEGDGLMTAVQSLGAAMLNLVDVESTQNASIGLQAHVSGQSLSWVNLDNVRLNENLLGGQVISQSPGVSLVTANLPDWDLGLDGLLGPVLPFADVNLRSASADRRLEASRNQAFGLTVLSRGEFGALTALLDVSANDNEAGYGLYANTESDQVAVNWVGSSDNLTELAQMGVGLLGLLVPPDNLPMLPPPQGVGPAQFNNNLGYGALIEAGAPLVALTGVVGAEAHANQGDGIIMTADAEIAAINLAARVQAHGNAANGLIAATDAQDVAVGIMLDAAAHDNTASGIRQEVEAVDGVAVGVIASTDALQPALDLLGDALGIPDLFTIPNQTPFGPVTAHDNGLDGVYSEVSGRIGAVGVHLDVHASDNGTFGLWSDAVSADGFAVNVVASSDGLFALADRFGAPLATSGLGPAQYHDNGRDGIFAGARGESMAVAALMGLEANNNEFAGIVSFVEAQNGDAVLLGSGLNVSDNAAVGFGGVLQARATAAVGLSSVSAHRNELGGVDVRANSAEGDVFAVLTGVEASDHLGAGARGILLNLTAPNGGIGVGLSGITAERNAAAGARVNATAGGNVLLLATSDAGVFPALGWGSILPYMLVLGVTDGFGPLELNDNGAGGLRAELTAGDDVNVLMTDVNARDNTTHGLTFNLEAGDDVSVNLSENVVTDNDGHGIRVQAASSGVVDAQVSALLMFNEASDNGSSGIFLDLSATDGSASALLVANLASGNTQDGVNVSLNASETATLLGRANMLVNNGRFGLRVNAAPGATTYNLNFGTVAEPGNNSVFGNGNQEVRNAGADTVNAQMNWWGTPTPAASQFGGSVVYLPALAAEPNP